MTKDFIPGLGGQNNYETLYGPITKPFYSYFLIFWGWAIIELINKFIKSDGIHRWELKVLFYGIAVSSLAGIFTNLILPWLGHGEFGYVGPAFSVVWLGVTSYIILKKP